MDLKDSVVSKLGVGVWQSCSRQEGVYSGCQKSKAIPRFLRVLNGFWKLQQHSQCWEKKKNTWKCFFFSVSKRYLLKLIFICVFYSLGKDPSNKWHLVPEKGCCVPKARLRIVHPRSQNRNQNVSQVSLKTDKLKNYKSKETFVNNCSKKP